MKMGHIEGRIDTDLPETAHLLGSTCGPRRGKSVKVSYLHIDTKIFTFYDSAMFICLYE